jgi:hypothetical protein
MRFVGGTGRSGTSVLGNVFASSEDTVYFSEPRFLSDRGGLPDYLDGRISYEVFSANMIDGFRPRLIMGLANQGFTEAARIYSPITVSTLLDGTLGSPALDKHRAAHSFVNRLFGLMLKETGRKYWVEKTPHTIVHVDMLYRLFPNMRYIHIVREPKDVYASMLTVYWGVKNAKEFVSVYRELMQRAYRPLRYIPKKNYLVVSLEGLVRDRMEVLRRVVDFAEIPFTDEQLVQAAQAVDRQTAHIGRWKDEISAQDAALVDKGCQRLYQVWRELEEKGNV